MCGIVGYVGSKISIKTAILQLKKLEYRGYDSSGVAYNQDNKIKTIKKVGQIDNLLGAVNNQSSNIMICHTRWATHGEVNQTNAHPQISYNNKYAVVHNGIIENYKELKNIIGPEKFISQTDTEVVANWLGQSNKKTIESLIDLSSKIEGSYSLAIIEEKSKILYVVKNKNPLYVAKVQGGYMVASDICALDSETYYALPDGVVGKLSKSKAEFFLDGKKVKLSPSKNLYNFDEVNLQGHKHYMSKEIEETTKVINNICLRYDTLFEKLFDKDMFEFVGTVFLVGCGTAYHACLMGASWIQRKHKINVSAHIASELRYSNEMIDDNSLVILVSQSGETADTLAVAQVAKERGAKVFVVTNVEYSTMAQLADKVYPLCAGPEIAVASTKAYSAMLSVLYMFANQHLPKSEVFENLSYLSKNLSIKVCLKAVETIKTAKRIFFIGRSDDGVTAQEASLKLRETSYLDSCGYYAGELKHGTIALVEDNVVVVAIITNDELALKTINAVEEVASRGAKVIVVTDNENLDIRFDKIVVPKIEDQELKSIMTVVPLQQLAYEVSTGLGKNPDKPRNLAKSVTVE